MYILGALSVNLGEVYPLIRLFTKGFVCFLVGNRFPGGVSIRSFFCNPFIPAELSLGVGVEGE